MSVTQIDIDDDALERVMALSRAKTKKEAVNLALQFYADKQERAASIALALRACAALGSARGRRAPAPCREGKQVIYLLDTSGLVRLLGERALQEAWYDAVDAEAIGSCYPQRTEFLYSAGNRTEYDEITEMFGDLYPDVSVPKNAGRWISSVQHHMAKAGEHRSASAVDLMIAATAAHHGLTVLHDDADYRTVARHAPDLSEHSIRDVS